MASTGREAGIGLRVAYYRDLAGMSQRDLAAKVGKTQAYISQIENRKRIVDKRSMLDALAAALGVSTNDLTGQPYTPITVTDLETYQVVPRVRAALEENEDEPVTPRPIGELEVMVDQAMAARMGCDVPALGRYLPDAIAELRHLWFQTGDRTAGELLVKALVTGSLALKAAGWVDLGIRLAELADTVATSHGDPVCIAAAKFAVAQCALTTGNRRRSARLVIAGADELDRMTRRGKLPPMLFNNVIAWQGILHLHAALSTAGTPDGDPQAHLAAAAALAPRVTGDPWRMEFSPDNVGVWNVGITLETGNPDMAPSLARRVNINGLRTKQRRSRLWLDTGRAAYITGDHEAAIRYLLRADETAPGDLRQRPTAVEIVGHLVHESGIRNEQLRDLAVRVGIPA